MAVSKNNIRAPIIIPRRLEQQLNKVAKEDKCTFLSLCAETLSDYVEQKKDGE